MGILSVHRGRSPNCSATGSVVGLALLSVAAAATVVNAFADRFTAWAGSAGDGTPDPDAPGGLRPHVRVEDFGAVLSWHDPPSLLYLDTEGRDAALSLGATVVGGGPTPPGALSAPTEVHLGVSDHCTARC